MHNDPQKPTVAVIGAGSIGAGWAIVFAQTGHDVRLFDAAPQRLADARDEIAARLRDLQEFGIMDDAGDVAMSRILFCGEFDEVVDGADHVQECIPEDLMTKKQIFADLDMITATDTVLASSSSFIPASAFAADLPGRNRILVVHPANPPFLLRVAEVVPAPSTDESVVARTEQLLKGANMAGVRLGGEIEGFAYNRLQGALLREAYCLVRDGFLSVADIDRLVRDGLGFRWSVIGPFETSDLNTRGGIEAHAARMGPYYARMGRERGQDDPWTEDLVARIADARRKLLPPARWQHRCAERDRALMALMRARRNDPALSICRDEE